MIGRQNISLFQLALWFGADVFEITLDIKSVTERHLQKRGLLEGELRKLGSVSLIL